MRADALGDVHSYRRGSLKKGMPADSRLQKLRQTYQTLVEPTQIARAARRTSVGRMANSSISGLTAKRSYTPFEGGSRLFRILRAYDDVDRLALIWAASLYVAAAGVGLVSARAFALPNWWVIAIAAIVAAIAERQAVPLTAHLETSVSFLPVMLAALAFGPGAGFLVAAGANVLNLQRPFLRWFAYTPIRALTGAAAGWAASRVLANHSDFSTILLASFAGSAAYCLTDLALGVATGAIRRSEKPSALLKALAPLLAVSLPLYVPTVALFVYGYRTYSLWIAGGFLIPILALQRVGKLYQDQREATRDLATANDRLERANLSFASALVATLDARDRYTAGHSAAVAIYARDIASRLGLSAEAQQLAHLCGLVHDIGKIGLPPGLLEKPGALTLEERRQMEEHSVIGERILANVEDYAEIAAIVRHHHERVDGNGYPDGVTGEAIPLLSRIIAVADAYNAMTSDRPYRDAMPSRVARMRLAQAADTQFDTAVVAAFEAVLTAAPEGYRMATRGDFLLAPEESFPTRLSEVA